MDDQASSTYVDDDSGSDSLSDSMGYSESESSVESVGSVEIECWKPKPKPPPRPAVSLRRRKKPREPGQKFMQFSKTLEGVPVEVVWDFISDHRMLASLVPGVAESFDYLDGEGGTGSVYVANYSPKSLRPGECKYQINKVEMSDHASKLFVVRSVGGKYQQRYHLYMTFIKVLADDVLGDGSSVVEWRFEYSLLNPNSVHPDDSKSAYMLIIDLIRERHIAVNRVERPIVNQAVVINVTKRLRLQAGQQRLTGADEQEQDDPSRRRRKEPPAQRSQIQDDEGSDRESKTTPRPLRKASKNLQAAGRGLVFRRRPRGWLKNCSL